MLNKIIDGFLYRSIDYKETSKICYLITSEGKISVKALGTKKYKNKNYNFSETISLVRCELTDSSFPSLVSYEIIDDLNQIKNDLHKTMWYMYLCEFLNKMPESSHYVKIYDYLLKVLKSNDYKAQILTFMLKMTSVFGINPNMKCCSICGNAPHFINISSGTSKCILHKSSNDYRIENIKNLYYLNIEDDIVSDVDLRELFDFVNSYYEYHEGFKLKSASTISLGLK